MNLSARKYELNTNSGTDISLEEFYGGYKKMPDGHFWVFRDIPVGNIHFCEVCGCIIAESLGEI